MLERPEAKLDRHELRKKMAGLGFQELINYSFISEEAEADFAEVKDPIKVLNPIASQMAVMRTQLISGLVDRLKYNLNRKADRAALFELGRIFRRDPSVKGSDAAVEGVYQPLHLAALVYGSARPAQWGERARNFDFFDLKGAVEMLLPGRNLRFEKSNHPHSIRDAPLLFISTAKKSDLLESFIPSSLISMSCRILRSSSSSRKKRFLMSEFRSTAASLSSSRCPATSPCLLTMQFRFRN